MSVKTENLKAGKPISFSGSYTVTFTKVAGLIQDLGIYNQIEMELDVLEGRDIYKIALTSNQITIEHSKALYRFPPEDYRWVVKYMIKPTKWGKAIYELNPSLIGKLWGLVADNQRMTTLKNVGQPWKITVPL